MTSSCFSDNTCWAKSSSDLFSKSSLLSEGCLQLFCEFSQSVPPSLQNPFNSHLPQFQKSTRSLIRHILWSNKPPPPRIWSPSEWVFLFFSATLALTLLRETEVLLWALAKVTADTYSQSHPPIGYHTMQQPPKDSAEECEACFSQWVSVSTSGFRMGCGLIYNADWSLCLPDPSPFSASDKEDTVNQCLQISDLDWLSYNGNSCVFINLSNEHCGNILKTR